MAGGRQAWCPRCDEVRAARPGADCPVCGRRLLAVPADRPGQPRAGWADRLLGRLRALAPAAGAVGVALLVLAVVASAFAAGRLTRTTPSGPAAAAPTTTVPGFLDEGPETGRRDFNWEAQDTGITVRLRSVTVGSSFTRLELHVAGVPQGREVSALDGLRVRALDGRDLLADGVIDHIATATSRPAAGGGLDTEVVLDRPIDQGAVASVELAGLTVSKQVSEELRASLLDPQLQRRLADHDNDDPEWLRGRRDCPGCRLRVTCPGCHTIRVTGTSYRRGQVVIAVQAVGRTASSVLSPVRRRVLVTDKDGTSELPGWIDADGASGVISFGADLLEVVGGLLTPDRPMTFRVAVLALAEQTLHGSWTIREAGG